jgi:hypothetical protein
MRFYNGVPITVVSGLSHMLTPTESTSRRRAAEEACLQSVGTSTAPNCRTQPRRNVQPR